MSQSNHKTSPEKLRYLILAAERQGRRIFQEALKEIGITGPQAEVLSVLKEEEPISLKELGSLLICENGSPSRLINRLVQEGWVYKETNTEDSRFILLGLSEEGKEKVLQIAKIENHFYKMIEQVIPNDIIENLNHQLSIMLSEQPISHALRQRGLLVESD